MTNTSGIWNFSRARQKPLKLVSAIKIKAAQTVSPNRSNSEANETHPPLIVTEPIMRCAVVSKNGLKIPSKIAKGATSRILLRI